eukprot:TRINITY_DN5568_c0_g1_i1.p1 TRINITY_DN5568_c0_g1~~TRINITY_DN5568_c0_g1_i1.p1  ORF type:complete len:335 (+),score=33.73 TRINITY_DN5568_c0_g1_i1:50-1054(+)
MKAVGALVLLAISVSTIEGHTFLSNLIIGGSATTSCLRPWTTGQDGTIFRNSPVNNLGLLPNGLLGPNMTCGFLPYASQSAPSKCTVAAGSQVGFQWWYMSSGDDVIADSHRGPIMIYLAKSNTGQGNVWFKIYEDGYTPSDKKWAAPDRLRANQGKVSVTIPSDISPGNYLVRTEIIALHEGYALHGSQPYVSCAELTITGSGTVNPAGVSFPGAYQENDPGILFSVYQGNTYTPPGPPVYVAGGNAGTPPPSSTPPPGTPSPPSGGLGSVCSEGISVCVQLCGQGNVKSCECKNGDSSIFCQSSGEDSDEGGAVTYAISMCTAFAAVLISLF